MDLRDPLFFAESEELLEETGQALQATLLSIGRERFGSSVAGHDEDLDEPFPGEVVASIGSNDEPLAEGVSGPPSRA